MFGGRVPCACCAADDMYCGLCTGFFGMKRLLLGDCFLSGLRSGLALPNVGCAVVGCWVEGFGEAHGESKSSSALLLLLLVIFGDGDCTLALMLASGGRSGFCGERYPPEDVRLASRSLTIVIFPPPLSPRSRRSSE